MSIARLGHLVLRRSGVARFTTGAVETRGWVLPLSVLGALVAIAGVAIVAGRAESDKEVLERASELYSAGKTKEAMGLVYERFKDRAVKRLAQMTQANEEDVADAFQNAVLATSPEHPEGIIGDALHAYIDGTARASDAMIGNPIVALLASKSRNYVRQIKKADRPRRPVSDLTSTKERRKQGRRYIGVSDEELFRHYNESPSPTEGTQLSHAAISDLTRINTMIGEARAAIETNQKAIDAHRAGKGVGTRGEGIVVEEFEKRIGDLKSKIRELEGASKAILESPASKIQFVRVVEVGTNPKLGPKPKGDEPDGLLVHTYIKTDEGKLVEVGKPEFKARPVQSRALFLNVGGTETEEGFLPTAEFAVGITGKALEPGLPFAPQMFRASWEEHQTELDRALQLNRIDPEIRAIWAATPKERGTLINARTDRLFNELKAQAARAAEVGELVDTSKKARESIRLNILSEVAKVTKMVEEAEPVGAPKRILQRVKELRSIEQGLKKKLEVQDLKIAAYEQSPENESAIDASRRQRRLEREKKIRDALQERLSAAKFSAQAQALGLPNLTFEQAMKKIGDPSTRLLYERIRRVSEVETELEREQRQRERLAAALDRLSKGPQGGTEKSYKSALNILGLSMGKKPGELKRARLVTKEYDISKREPPKLTSRELRIKSTDLELTERNLVEGIASLEAEGETILNGIPELEDMYIKYKKEYQEAKKSAEAARASGAENAEKLQKTAEKLRKIALGVGTSLRDKSAELHTIERDRAFMRRSLEETIEARKEFEKLSAQYQGAPRKTG